MKRNYFTLAFFLCVTCALAQAQDCYNRSRTIGIEDYEAGKYDSALDYFRAALDCPDKPDNNDINSWKQKCNNAKQKKNANPVIVPTEPKVEKQTATLRITSTPTASWVYINNIYVGQTPIIENGLPLGQTKIEIRQSGFKNYANIINLKQGDNYHHALLIEENKTATPKTTPAPSRETKSEKQQPTQRTYLEDSYTTVKRYSNYPTTKFGITGGLGLLKFYVDEPTNNEPDATFGFQAGLIVDFPLSESFSLVPELLYAQRGADFSDIAVSGTSTIMTLNYLQLPVNVMYKKEMTPSSNFLLFAGVYAGYGIDGKSEVENYSDGEYSVDDGSSGDLKFGSGEDEINPLDFGINAGLGFLFGDIFFVKMQLSKGVTNISNSPNTTITNFRYGIDIGFFF
ncbi:hypothetical protein SAMD00024442_1_4 [Candidatus Symbiothrix dinenymphae]|nr:hypothetical protein SAMD00024442_1_4 [Candidatus Symbiothrix dinenymphae]